MEEEGSVSCKTETRRQAQTQMHKGACWFCFSEVHRHTITTAKPLLPGITAAATAFRTCANITTCALQHPSAHTWRAIVMRTLSGSPSHSRAPPPVAHGTRVLGSMMVSGKPAAELPPCSLAKTIVAASSSAVARAAYADI